MLAKTSHIALEELITELSHFSIQNIYIYV